MATIRERGAGAAGEQPTLFLRKASGVVKAFSPLDSFAYNTLANNPLTLGSLSFLLIPWAFPGGNIPIAVILAAVGGAFAAITYAFLQAAMPRTGGDYVFQSRLLGGAVGFIVAFATYGIASAVFLGLNGWMFSACIFGPLFQMLGGALHVQWMLDFASVLTSQHGMFIGGLIMVLWITFMCSIPFSAYARVQRWFFWIGAICTAFAALLLLVNTQAGFKGSLDTFVSQNFGVANVYQTTIDRAKAAGFSPDLNFNWNATLMAVPSAWLIILSSMWGAGNAGEIRDKGTVRTKIYQIAGSLAFSAGIAALFGYFIVSRFGSEFLSSATYLSANAPDQQVLPIQPFMAFFIEALSANPLVIVLVFLAFFCWWWMANPNAGIYPTRVILAMGMDRAIPSWFAQVNSRTHTPLNAMLTVGALGIFFDWMYSYYPGFPALTAALGLLIGISYAIVCLGAALWPYLKPEAYAGSPAAKYKIAGIPAITVTGTLFDLFVLYIIVQFLTVPQLGVAGSTLGYMFAFGSFVLGAVLFVFLRWYRKSRESLDLGLVFKEIPPE